MNNFNPFPMKKKILVLLPLIFFGLISLFAQPPAVQTMTLQECLQKAIDYSPRLKISIMEQSKLRYGYKETVGAGLPAINLSGSFDDFVNLPTQLIPGEFFGKPGEMIPVQFGTTYNISGSLDFSQIVYNQTWLAALRISKLMMEQNELGTESAKTNLVFEVAQSYYYAQIASNQIRNLESNHEKLRKAEQIARSQFEKGLIMKVDVDRIVVNKLNIQTQIDRLKVTYEQQLNFQRYLMGLDLNTPLEFPDTVAPAVVKLKEQIDFNDHIDIRTIEKQKQIAVAGMKLNQAAYFPAVTLIGSINYMNQSNDFYLFGNPTDWFNTSLLGLRLNVPLFSGLQKKYRVSQSRVEIEQLSVTENDTRRILEVQARDAAGRLVTAITDEQRQRENMSLAERVYGISQEQYQKGLISLTDLLNAESGLSDAQTNHSMALVQMKIAELEYLKANGTLLETLTGISH